MLFEYDPAKSHMNACKHGIDFEQAQGLWSDDRLLVAAARTDDEPRWLAVGMLDGKCWTAVFTIRGQAVRIISVRRARKEEIERYEGE